MEAITVRNKDDGFIGNLYRWPGQEELYDKVRKEVMEKGEEVKGALVGGSHSFFGCYYALYR